MGLAAYAMDDRATRGRRHREAAHPYRSEYQRDRDRIVHSKAFRRLEKKTQVFEPAYSDHFRNRLTHTIEVSQIARTISRALQLNTDLCEVLALSHDIGHPPFSHEGERVLDLLMKEQGSGFDHNLHALRIVEYFEEKYAGFRGLNLTFEVREGIVKHSSDFDGTGQVYVDISEYCVGLRPPLEAQLIDFADEIAYNTADLDDGYDAGLLDCALLREEVELFRSCFDETTSSHRSAPEKLRVRETVSRMINVLVTDLIADTRARLKSEGVDSIERVRTCPRRMIGFSDELGSWNRQLKEFLHRNLYSHGVLAEARRKAQHLLEKLFHHYVEDPGRLPPKHQGRIDRQGLHRVVCDYMAGMTDVYAQSRYDELFGSC